MPDNAARLTVIVAVEAGFSPVSVVELTTSTDDPAIVEAMLHAIDEAVVRAAGEVYAAA